MNSRRSFLKKLGAGTGLLAVPGVFAERGATGSVTASSGPSAAQHVPVEREKRERGARRVPQPLPVETPDIADLPWRMANGVKEFHLIAEPVNQSLLPGRVAKLWGFNGSAPGPTVQINQGDRVRFIVDNHLPEPFSMHWHGLEVPFDMDGAPGTSQEPILPGGRFVYEFTLNQEGTYFYHSHMAMQEMMGMIGAFIIHPRVPYDPPIDRDFVIILQEYAILPDNPIPNSMNMEFNWLTMNGKAGPAITPMIVRQGDRVKIRLINLGMDHHPIHLHGHQFFVTGTEGGHSPKSTWFPHNTVLVGVAQARDVEFIAHNLGDWMFHCHLPHHMMNAMSSNVGPMTRRAGMPMGREMDLGMGIPTMGSPRAPLSDEYGPSLGRGMGVGSTADEPITNGPLSPEQAQKAMPNMPSMPQEKMQHGNMPGMQNTPGVQPNTPLPSGTGMQSKGYGTEIAPNANAVPGFPQDAYMESPMMAMDKMVEKPENFGLRSGWSGFMQGMMTFVRILPPDMYAKIISMRQQQKPTSPDAMPGMQHGPHGC